MSDKQEYPRIYTIHSQKGGVGKTSIALAIAGLESCLKDKKTIIIDADFTGTSIGDLWPEKKMHGVKYFNELILAKPNEFEESTSILPKTHKNKSRLSNYYFQIDVDRELYIMAGSPFFKDILQIVPLISQEDHLHFFRHRLEDVITSIFQDGFEVVIVDNAPGLFGLSRTTLIMALDQIANDVRRRNQSSEDTRLEKLYNMAISKSNDRHINIITLLVTSGDEVDHKALVPSLGALLKMHGLEPKQIEGNVNLINNKALNKKGAPFDPYLAMGEIFKNLKQLKDPRSVSPELIEFFMKQSSDRGALSCQYINSFDMGQILSSVISLKNEKGSTNVREPGVKDWCRQIANSVGIEIGTLSPRA